MKALFRMAFRDEGSWWVAYMAPQMDSMANAKEMGRIRISLAQDAKVREAFQATMKAGATFMVQQIEGLEITAFEERPVPEHEKCGHG